MSSILVLVSDITRQDKLQSRDLINEYIKLVIKTLEMKQDLNILRYSAGDIYIGNGTKLSAFMTQSLKVHINKCQIQ